MDSWGRASQGKRGAAKGAAGSETTPMAGLRYANTRQEAMVFRHVYFTDDVRDTLMNEWGFVFYRFVIILSFPFYSWRKDRLPGRRERTEKRNRCGGGNCQKQCNGAD